jgi:hypothetical protein
MNGKDEELIYRPLLVVLCAYWYVARIFFFCAQKWEEEWEAETVG